MHQRQGMIYMIQGLIQGFFLGMIQGMIQVLGGAAAPGRAAAGRPWRWRRPAAARRAPR